MKEIRKQSKKLEKELINLKTNRKSIDEFLLNFLQNIYDNSILMHSIIANENNTKTLVTIESRQYSVFLVSCWETFFRDIFVYVYSIDKKSLSKLVNKFKPFKKNDSRNEIELAELLSESFNFQNLKDIRKPFDILWDSDFLQYICSKEFEYIGMNGKIASGFSIDSLFPNWNKIINNAFETRHKVIHYANFRPIINFHTIQQTEALFVIFPQVMALLLIKKYGFKTSFFSVDYPRIPYLFSIKDILATDWGIID